MERKLIRQGKGGLTIYLPKKWIDKKNLTESDTVNVEEDEENLIVGSKKNKKQEIEIDINEENRKDLKPLLTHLYREGFSKIVVKNTDKNSLKIIKELVKNLLMGFEIVSASKDACVLENISEPTENRYDAMIRKVFLSITETQEFIRDSFEKNSFKDIGEIEDLRNSTDRFVLFCRRLISQRIHSKNPLLEWELLTFLTHIQHSYYYLYKYAGKSEISKEKELIFLLSELEMYFKLFQKSYLEKDIYSIHKINSSREKYHQGVILKDLEKSTKSRTVVLSYLREIFRLIQLGTSPILSMALKERH